MSWRGKFLLGSLVAAAIAAVAGVFGIKLAWREASQLDRRNHRTSRSY
jgi:hypothetical protein